MPVTVQIAPERLQIKAKGRNVQVYLSTFNAEMAPFRGELNSYQTNTFNFDLIATNLSSLLDKQRILNHTSYIST